MASIADLVGITVKTVINDTSTIDNGFQCASLSNLGSASATITQNGQSFILPSGSTFNFPVREGNKSWYGLSIVATTTTVQVVYF
jgi:hypothetical protein